MTRTLSLDEAASMLKTTADTVSDCIRFKGLPAAKIGRAWVLVDDDLISWLRSQYQQPNPRKEPAAAQAATLVHPSRKLAEALAPSPRRRRIPAGG